MANEPADNKKIVPFSDSNLAYELRDFEERHMKRSRQPVQRTHRRPQKQGHVLVLSRTALFAVVSFVTLMTLLLTVVYSYMQLNEITTANSRLRSQLQTLQTEEGKLNTALEQQISLQELQERATSMGMIEPSGDQIQWFDLSGEDHAVVVEPEKGWLEQITSAIAGFFGVILE